MTTAYKQHTAHCPCEAVAKQHYANVKRLERELQALAKHVYPLAEALNKLRDKRFADALIEGNSALAALEADILAQEAERLQQP